MSPRTASESSRGLSVISHPACSPQGHANSTKQHPHDFTPLIPSSRGPAGLSCPPCPALSTSAGCTASPSMLEKARPHSSSLAGRTSRTWFWTPGLCPDSLCSFSQPQDPLGAAANPLFSAAAAAECCSAKALRKITAEGWQPKASRGAAPCVWEKPVCFPGWHFTSLRNVGAGRLQKD